ncbi:DUF3159 domain-containing protein [Naasia sp. SYSU D00948]|uniref:DUF3159 domain-containing protein n=1 Tax=Naasia sp. SYSU D00948 TaxID=2817379 RepID=UPI001B309BC9|nr:DUF3159 domain-containing protein [Naasia sp. SYSU D00948]
MTAGRDDRAPGVEDALAQAARRAGFDRAAGPVTGRSVLEAVGGIRGILESLVPGLVFVVLFALTNLPLALGVSVGLAAAFVGLRALQRSPVAPAVGGLLAAVVSAALALITGRPEDNFVLGLIQNAVYGGVLLASVLVGWPLIGLAVGFLLGEGTAWRKERRKFVAMQGLTLLWVGLFALRLLVQLPLYYSGQVELLGTFKLIMGIPLFAPLLVLSWLIVRAAFPAHTRAAQRGGATGL